MPPKKSFRLLFAAASALLLIHAYYYFPFIADDSFVAFRYIDRLMTEQGLTWTDGKPVEGYSNLLWILILAFFKLITGGELWLIAICVSLACTITSLWLLLKITARATDYNRAALVWAAALFVLSAPVAIWINGGLEAPLTMLLLMAGLERVTLMRPLNGRMLLAGFYLGLLALTRPDGILFAWAVSLGLVFLYTIQEGDNPAPIKLKSWLGRFVGCFMIYFKPLLLLNIIVILFYSAQLIFRLVYYGEWVPNNALVKTGSTTTGFVDGALYVAKMLLVYLPFLLLALVITKKAATKNRAVLSLLATVILTSSLYLMLTGGDDLPGYRHVLPLVPALCIFCGIVAQLLRERWLRQTAVYVALSLVVFVAVFAIQFKDSNNRTSKTERWEWDAMAIGNTIGTGFANMGPTIATTAVGALPYYAKLPALPGYALGDADYYKHQSPDILFFSGLGTATPQVAEETALYHDTAFINKYQRVKLAYQLDYTLPLPACDAGSSRAVKMDKFCYMYMKKESNKTGIYFDKNNMLVVPSYFFKSTSLPDSATTLSLGSGGNLVVTINPGETFFIETPYASPVSEPRIASADSLLVKSLDKRIEVFNPGKDKAVFKEVRLLFAQP